MPIARVRGGSPRAVGRCWRPTTVGSRLSAVRPASSAPSSMGRGGWRGRSRSSSRPFPIPRFSPTPCLASRSAFSAAPIPSRSPPPSSRRAGSATSRVDRRTRVRSPWAIPSARHSGGRLARHIDADFADLLSRVTTGLWRRGQRAPAGRSRRPIIVSAGIAAAVLAVGLMWPTGTEGPATADVDLPVQTRGRMPRRRVRRALRSQRRLPRWISPPSRPTCSRSAPPAAARESAWRTSRRIRPRSSLPGAIDLPADQRTVTLLDDFGGAAVLRVEPVTRGAGRAARPGDPHRRKMAAPRCARHRGAAIVRSIRCRDRPRTVRPRGAS